MRQILMNIQFWLMKSSSNPIKFVTILQRSLEHFTQSNSNYISSDVIEYFRHSLLSELTKNNNISQLNHDEIVRKNILECFLGFVEIVIDHPHGLWNILTKTTTHSLSLTTTVFETLYGTQQKKNDYSTPNQSVPIISSSLNNNNLLFNNTNDIFVPDRISFSLMRDQIEFVAELSEQLNLDLVHENYLSFFTPPCLPYHEQLFNIQNSINLHLITTKTDEESRMNKEAKTNISFSNSTKRIGQKVFDYMSAICYDMSLQDYLLTFTPQVRFSFLFFFNIS
jgi:hypothetical protein